MISSLQAELQQETFSLFGGTTAAALSRTLDIKLVETESSRCITSAFQLATMLGKLQSLRAIPQQSVHRSSST
jgi:hypothetical protein